MIIPVSKPSITKNDIKAVDRCLESGWVSSAGPTIYEFANLFSNYLGTKYALPVATGTAALHLALLALEIKPSDEVVVPALTFISPASMTAAIGAKPVFVDVAKDDFLIDQKKIEEKISKKTKAIIVVHLYGHPVVMEPILKLANKYNLKIIEDCAEALGAKYKGKFVGSYGDLACFSFYGNKFITTGEGGMLTTNNHRFFSLAQLYCDHGMTKKLRYYHRVVGFNYRMTAMQAALGKSQLKKLPKFLKLRKNINEVYQKELKELTQIKWVKPAELTNPTCWLTTILLPNKQLRDRLSDHLFKKGVETRKVFFPIPGMPPYPTTEKFPNAHKVAGRGLSLPTFVGLKNSEIKYICKEIKNFFNC